MPGILDRRALYYPYIHIRDVNWLKATLLAFPQVRRMVPPDFHLNDSPEVQQFGVLKGPGGEPLLIEESTDTSAVGNAQHRLTKKLDEMGETTWKCYSYEVAMIDYPTDYNSFQIYRGKMMYGFLEYLFEKHLAWPARQGDEWFALHPKMGEALMSLIAIAIARDKGLDIVTCSGDVHRALALQDEDEIFTSLLSLGKEAPKVTSGETRTTELVDELAELVMTSCFDLERLNAEQIAELIKEGKDLRRFKNALIPIAETIPDIHDPSERKKRLTTASEQVIEEWNAYRKSLPKFAFEALVDVSKLKTPDIAGSILAGAATGATIATGVGLAIGLVTYAGIGILRKYREQTSSPYQYLSSIEKAGAKLVLRPGRK